MEAAAAADADADATDSELLCVDRSEAKVSGGSHLKCGVSGETELYNGLLVRGELRGGRRLALAETVVAVVVFVVMGLPSAERRSSGAVDGFDGAGAGACGEGREAMG